MAAVFAMVGVGGLITALIDMGMNGTRNALWAPWGLGIGLICFVGLWLAGVR